MKMDQATYERWRPLHVRFAKGEALSPEDRAFYDAVCRQLDEEELLSMQPLNERIARAQERIASLEKERASLDARCREVQAQIEDLEATLRKRSGTSVGVGG